MASMLADADAPVVGGIPAVGMPGNAVSSGGQGGVIVWDGGIDLFCWNASAAVLF